MRRKGGTALKGLGFTNRTRNLCMPVLLICPRRGTQIAGGCSCMHGESREGRAGARLVCNGWEDSVESNGGMIGKIPKLLSSGQ